MLPSTGLKDHLGAKEYWPVYAEAERLGCALGMHGGAHSGLGLDHLNNYTPVGALGHPFGLLINFAGVVFNGVLDRSRTCAGALWRAASPGCCWRWSASSAPMSRTSSTTRAASCAGGRRERVSAYIRKHVAEGRLFVGCEGDEPTLSALVKAVGAGAFVFSSDFPHEVNNDICKHEIEELLETPDLTDADKEACCGATPRASMGLSAVRSSGARGGKRSRLTRGLMASTS